MQVTKNKNYKKGPDYHWRVATFCALGQSFKVLILINQIKEIYRAYLGVDCGGDMRVLCHHEYHASEPGWHCHLHTGDINGVEPGLMRTGMRRWPQGEGTHSKMDFGVTQTNAVAKAFELFKVRDGFI